MTRREPAPPPDPNARLHFLCDRCERHVWAYGVATECIPCRHAAAVAGLRPMQGEVSGS